MAIQLIVAFEDDVVRAEVFSVDGGKPTVRVIDIDSGLVLPTFKVFSDTEKATAYAKRCVHA